MVRKKLKTVGQGKRNDLLSDKLSESVSEKTAEIVEEVEENKEPDCEGICQQRFCDNIQNQFFILNLNGMEVLVAMCDEHAYEFDNNMYAEEEVEEGGN